MPSLHGKLPRNQHQQAQYCILSCLYSIMCMFYSMCKAEWCIEIVEDHGVIDFWLEISRQFQEWHTTDVLSQYCTVVGLCQSHFILRKSSKSKPICTLTPLFAFCFFAFWQWWIAGEESNYFQTDDEEYHDTWYEYDVKEGSQEYQEAQQQEAFVDEEEDIGS